MSKFFIYIALIGCLASCTEYGRVVKKGNLDEKYDMALKMYKVKDYVRALPLLEELLAVYRGKEKSEEIYFYYSYCYYGLGQYDLASYHFKNFTENYYNSKHMEECAYRYVDCLYQNTLPSYLDQSNTALAIGEIQLFLNKYPSTQFKEACNMAIEDLRKNLKDKSFNNAMLFYHIEDYHAAIVSFKNILKDFPDMENKDQIEFLIVKCAYFYAKYSIDEKKVERYKDVFTEFVEYAKNNKPENKWFKEAKDYNEKGQLDLIKYKKLNNIQ